LINKILIIGYGSIAKKHLISLKRINKFNKIFIYSRRNIEYKNAINSFDKIIDIDPDYFVIATETSSHFKFLNFIVRNFQKKIILVEKPLFKNFQKLNINNNKVFVGYNLRMHPILQYLNKNIRKQKIWYVDVKCDSYLPAWRKNTNYVNTSSAKKSLGGGVLLDLSHELDYLTWIFGRLTPKFVKNLKISNLKVTSDDFLLLYAVNKDKIHFNVSLNYFSKIEMRQISIKGENINILADLINNKIEIINKSQKIINKYKKFNIYDTYFELHKSILSGKVKKLCDYYQGVQIMKLIKEIKSLN
jgi:predicted dehydrogenase|tara:strand:- start:3771 stop:4679 length:909 start_codon:yes stop_codon:yes gene_type:complete